MYGIDSLINSICEPFLAMIREGRCKLPKGIVLDVLANMFNSECPANMIFLPRPVATSIEGCKHMDNMSEDTLVFICKDELTVTFARNRDFNTTQDL